MFVVMQTILIIGQKWALMDGDIQMFLPFFKRMENAHLGESELRGNSGPLHVTRGPRDNPLHHAFVDAACQAGYAHTKDYNGYQ